MNQAQLDFPDTPFGGESRTSSTESRESARASFIDGVATRASFTFKAQQMRDARLMAEDEKFDKYRAKLKAVSLFFVFFSVFILLNASIGASSAPFYDKYTDCTKYELTEKCEELMKYTSALYGFEFIGSVVLVIHGLLGMTLLEYIKKTWLIRTLNYYTKIALFFYAGDALLRCSMYFKILNLIAPEEEVSHEQDFGGFLAVACQNQALSVAVTTILLVFYSCCFLSNCYLWKLSADLYRTAKEVETEKERSKRGSSVASHMTDRTVSLEESIGSSSTGFEDFDYNKNRAKKASQVILSINDDHREDAKESLLSTTPHRPEGADMLS